MRAAGEILRDEARIGKQPPVRLRADTIQVRAYIPCRMQLHRAYAPNVLSANAPYKCTISSANAPSVVSAIPNMWLLPPHQGGNYSSQYINLQDRPSTVRRGRQGVVEKSLICDIEIKGQAPPLMRPLPFFVLALGPTPLLQDWRSCSTHNPPCRIYGLGWPCLPGTRWIG